MKLEKFEKKIFSQNGEDGIINYLSNNFNKINYFVEIGVESDESNCLYLKNQNINGLFLDAEATAPWIKNEFIDKDNVLSIFKKYNVPEKFEFLSIDVDFNTYWILKSIIESNSYEIDYVCLEYNGQLGYSESKAVPYDPKGVWDGSFWYGASLLAFKKLLSENFELIYCENNGVNAFFLNKKFKFETRSINEIYKPLFVNHRTPDPDKEKWIWL